MAAPWAAIVRPSVTTSAASTPSSEVPLIRPIAVSGPRPRGGEGARIAGGRCSCCDGHAKPAAAALADAATEPSPMPGHPPGNPASIDI